jgi:hypothetical protein
VGVAGDGEDGRAKIGEPIKAQDEIATMAAALLTREGFEHAIEALIARADGLGRGADLDRVASRLGVKTPKEVSHLAALNFMLDQEFLLPLQEAVEAYRRWLEKKGEPTSDEQIMLVLRDVYTRVRKAAR